MTFTLNQILLKVIRGKKLVTFKFPDSNPIQGIITDINIADKAWKPISVNIITNGLTITDHRFEEHPMTNDDVLVEYQRPYITDRINLKFITHIEFESNIQTKLEL
jgi:hypothetical protein